MQNNPIQWYNRILFTRILFPLTTFFLTLFSSPAILSVVCSSKKNVEISGKVANKYNGGKPLPNTKVVIEGVTSTTTDKDGNFTITYPTKIAKLGLYLCPSCEQETTIVLKVQNDSLNLNCIHTMELENSAIIDEKSKNNYILLPTQTCNN